VSDAALPSSPPGRLRVWVMACRPATLPVAIAPVLVGTAIARLVGGVHAKAAFAAAWGALCFQIASNLANDVFDHEKGADTAERLGPLRVTQAGLLSPRAVRLGMLVVIALAIPAGLYLTAVAGWPVVAIGVASIAAALAYTGGPWPLGYHGLGDPFVFLFFGLVAVVGTVFVQTGAAPLVAWPPAVGVGAIATAVLVVNNVRDRETDVRAGKRTLAVRLGRRGAIAEYGLLLATAYAVPVGLRLSLVPSGWVLIPLASAPLGVKLARAVASSEGRALNPLLGGTARLLLVYSALLAAGLALAAR
jgi:1,4-dihydroxy-2-naphthoate octaprenyltransferase